MPRRRIAEKREVVPDPKYGSELVSRLINLVMREGKKSVAEGIVYRTLEIVGKKAGKSELSVVKQAVSNVMPLVEVKSRRVGGATYQVPVEVRDKRKSSLGIRWIVDFARKRSEKAMVDRLVGEILDASVGRGGAVKKKDETHKMAEANKAFAHYKW